MEQINDLAGGDNGKMLKGALGGSAGCGITAERIEHSSVGAVGAASTDTLWLAMHVNNNNNNAHTTAFELDSRASGCDDVFSAATVAAENQQQEHNKQKNWKRHVGKPLRALCEAVGVSSTSSCSPSIAVSINHKFVMGGRSGTGSGSDSGGVSVGAMTTEEAYCGAIVDGVSGNTVKDKGGGYGSQEQLHLKQNGMSSTMGVTAISNSASNSCREGDAEAASNPLDAMNYDIYVAEGAAVGATSLTPPDNSPSERTSINNSTENLSYSSDNYYPDDLILLGDGDDDVEAEEISLNSDDCVYAYRGDGTDFDLTMDVYDGRSGRGLTAAMIGDDETDFLEMDFEPDPLSEIEYGFVGMSLEPPVDPHMDALLLQRDACQLGGGGGGGARHTSLHMGNQHQRHSPATQRQLFSSPIDDVGVGPGLTAVPKAALQSQALLSKNFARITLHLDQIKGEVGDYDNTRNERLSALDADDLSAGGIDMSKTDPTISIPSAHSLPNTLHTHFGRDDDAMGEQQEKRVHSAKMTGATPKRLSTFSTSSSTSSKNSCKSRTSLRSAYAVPLCNSSSFDERSVSCTEFRTGPAGGPPIGSIAHPTCKASTDDTMPSVANTAGVASSGGNCDDFNLNDETCLDCLEKEFLANTIGKALEPHICPKCRRRAGGYKGNGGDSRTFYARSQHTRCRSGSPAFLLEMREDMLFETANQLLLSQNTRVNSISTDQRSAAPAQPSSGVQSFGGPVPLQLLSGHSEGGLCGNATLKVREMCDNYKQAQNFSLTEPEIVTISTQNLNEETLVQALDKLHIVYNAELLKSHFRCKSSALNLQKTLAPTKNYKSLKHFLLHESKRHCNRVKLKRLVELATRQQVAVHFNDDDNNTSHTEMVPIKVNDILHQWTRSKNLALLKQLDKRFVEANVLGKIANIIRHAQQRCTIKRPLPEFISVPQYYTSGYLVLTKKC